MVSKEMVQRFRIDSVSLSTKLVTALPVVLVGGWMMARGEIPWSLIQHIGLLLIVVGLSLLTLARLQFEKYGSAYPGLVTQGVYRRVRHPMYVSSSVAFAGLLLYLNEPLGVVLMLPIQVFLFYLAKREEHELEAMFGQHYRAYKQKTWF